MFNALGSGIFRHPVAWITGWAIALAIGLAAITQGFGSGGLFERLATTEPAVPGTESQTVQDFLSSQDDGDSVILVITGVQVAEQQAELSNFVIDQQEYFNAIDGALAHHPFAGQPTGDPGGLPPDGSQLPPGMANPQALVSSKGDGFVITIGIDPALSEEDTERTHDEVVAIAEDFRTAFISEFPDSQVRILSNTIIGDDVTALTQRDLVRGETISMPVALILLIIIFGGVLAAGLPLIGSAVAIVLGMAGIWVATFFMDINNFILNVISIIGLALSIDYGLLVVSRYREELATMLTEAGFATDDIRLPGRQTWRELQSRALVATVATAGRTVVFSALTIACSIMGLAVFVSPILRAIALGGMIVTLLAVATAVTLVPAIITLLGTRLVRPSPVSRLPVVRHLAAKVGDASPERGVFSHLAHLVHRIPVVIIIVVGALMTIMAWPVSDLRTRANFVEYLPQGSDTKTAYYLIQDEYPALATADIIIIAEKPHTEISGEIEYIESLHRVQTVLATPIGDGGTTRIDVHLDVTDPVSPEVMEDLVELRGHDPGYPWYVGGAAAMSHDFTESLIVRAPGALAIVSAAVIILLFLMTGSLMVPVKALLLNFFSLTASLGATVWIFEGGHLGMPQVPGLEVFIVACMVAFGFGLSMDYEVFLVARIKEYWDAGLTNDQAVEHGLQRSGRIITSAAAIIVAVFIGFISGEMIAMKEIGVALAIMVVVDATLVRMLLVPATMTLLGKWNWWVPHWLARIYQRFQIRPEV